MSKKCFQYAITTEFNHKSMTKDPQRTSKIKSFINKYNWEEINFLSHLKHISSKGELLIFNCLKFSKNHKKTF